MLTKFVKVAEVGQIADGEMAVVTPEGEELLLARIGDRYYAIDNLCSHAFGMLNEGMLFPVERQVECPIHEGRFDLVTGEPKRAPAEEAVKAYSVQVDGSDILVGPKQD